MAVTFREFWRRTPPHQTPAAALGSGGPHGLPTLQHGDRVRGAGACHVLTEDEALSRGSGVWSGLRGTAPSPLRLPTALPDDCNL